MGIQRLLWACEVGYDYEEGCTPLQWSRVHKGHFPQTFEQNFWTLKCIFWCILWLFWWKYNRRIF